MSRREDAHMRTETGAHTHNTRTYTWTRRGSIDTHELIEARPAEKRKVDANLQYFGVEKLGGGWHLPG